MREQIREDVIYINKTLKKSLLQLVERGDTLERVEEGTRVLASESQIFNQQIRRQRLGAPLAYLAERWEEVLSFANSLDLSFCAFLCCSQL